MVKKFSEEGAISVLVDINIDALEQVAKDFDQDLFQADVSNPNDMLKLSKYVLKKYEKIDIMVNNAGITHLPMPLEDVTEEEFDKVFAVNAKAVFFCGKYSIITNFAGCLLP